MQIAIEIPNDSVAIEAKPTIRKEIATYCTLGLYRQKWITRVKSAHVAGMKRYDFMQVCKNNRIAVIEVSRVNQPDELNGLMPA